MKRRLTKDDALAAVWGGAVLGGGGGGHVEAGLATSALALDAGPIHLVELDALDPDLLTATVALVGTPSSPDACVYPAHALRAFELLNAGLPDGRALGAIHTNENGPETTINGWFAAAVSGLPVVDFACNGRAHPTGLMGSMGLHAVPGYVSQQAFAGGDGERYVEALVRGRLDDVAAIVRRASEGAGGFVSVCRNPVALGYARDNGAPGAISQAIRVGMAYLDGGIDAVATLLSASIVAEGRVTHYECLRRDGLDVGQVVLDDAAGTTLEFVNEYMFLEQHGAVLHTFPDLVCTFVDGRPTVSARIAVGDSVQVLVAPSASLVLSPTMWMKDLYLPVERLLGRELPLDPSARGDASSRHSSLQT